MEVVCSVCWKSFQRSPSEVKRRKDLFCSTKCAQIQGVKCSVGRRLHETPKSPFDKRIVELKELGLTYQQIADTLIEEKFQSPSGKPIGKILVQSRFNYIIGRRFGPVKVWRGSVRRLKVPDMITLRADDSEVSQLRKEVYELKQLLKNNGILRRKNHTS